MRQQVFYIHGGDAYSDYNAFLEDLKTRPIRDLPDAEYFSKWSGSFREDMGDDYEVFMPSMPNKQNSKYEEWKIWFERHLEYLHDGVILVGWSQGGYFFAKYLVENDFPVQIKGLLLLAAPFEAADYGGGEDGGDFRFDTTRAINLASKAKNIVIMHSKDDFVVPYEHALRYHEALPEAEFITFVDKNHFLIEEFPELLDKIREISQKA